ncbi:MAG: EAL domain-containing protein [Betaproteobacteria bacterium]|nr:EAL domain-containing protein [Betaproteobacteria bacterium]
MMRLPGTLGTRVARRILGLFLVCALLPVALVLLLSYTQVQRTVGEQQLSQLSQAADQYGGNVLERLVLASNLARAFARSNNGGDGEVLGHYFTVVANIGPAGDTTFLHGPARPIPPAVAELASDPPIEKPALRVAVEKDGSRAVWLVTVRNANESGAGVVAARLEPGYLWGAPDDLPYLTGACVLDVARAPLYCSDPLPAKALEGLRAKIDLGTSGSHVWEGQRESYVSGFRELFLPSQFNAAAWTVVMSLPEARALAPARALRQLVLPVGLLGLLVAALLSLVQVRRTMGPLGQLRDATKRIAERDFETRVPALRNDEFGELAHAFNTMSDRLGRQFHALGTLAQIDAEILSKVDIDRVVAILPARIKEVIQADWRMVLLAEAGASGAFRVRVADAEATGMHHQLITLPDPEIARLNDSSVGVRIESAAPGSALSKALAQVGARSLFVLPIALKGRLAGLIVLGYQGEASGPSEDEARLLRDLGDRVAVALATAERDYALFRQANFDSLTGLPNRPHFMDLFAREITRAERHETLLALLFIDLDGFSQVNDELGHSAGDELLMHAADRLRACLRKADVVARLGGDEFTVLVPDVREPEDVAIVAKHLIEVLSQPFTVSGTETFVAASVGTAIFPTDGGSTDELLRNADTAMYRAKEQGRGTHVFFKAEMTQAARRRAELDRELRRALDEEQFVLYYQPQLDLASGRITGAEALVRWIHPTRGLVPPGHFIPVAEDTGLIERLGDWVLRDACAQFVRWQAEDLPLEHVSVNVSPRQFHRRGFAETVASVLRSSGMPVERLLLEITESVLVDRTGAADATLAQLVRLGARLSLDDFGTGYSSLSYLQHLPVAAIKLDRSFIIDIVESEDARAIARSILAMVQALRKEVVAEGVETPEQLALLARWGCDAIQGYYIAKPLPAKEFERLVREFVAPEGIGRSLQQVTPITASARG